MPGEIDDSCITRSSLKYENHSKKFITSTRNYTKQYCSIYITRLEHMGNVLTEKAKARWGEDYPIVKLHKLSETDCDKCIVIGTLFKDQKLKPSIVKQLSEANQLVPQPILTNFTDDSDVLLIEDELQRYQIIGNLKKNNVVTGITCALLGKDIGKGKFDAEDYIFIDFHPQIERPIFEQNFYVLLLSGLDLIHLEKTNIILQIIPYWLSGLIELDETINSKDICRVIIAGNSVRTAPEKAKPTISMTSRIPESADTIDAVKILDEFLLKICQIIDVDIMPGENDPSNHILPQQPLHHCMFPKSSKYRSLNQVPNPYKCLLDGVKVLGTSGQPIRDILRFSDLTDPLDALESCLKWSHLAPTAPDTLGCFPFYEEDPFILDDCPHVFFAGNQESFGTRKAKGPQGQEVCLVSIPEFSTTLQACLLNLKNLECNLVSFKS
ncbi:DNA polymerase delta subunit 2 [Coccinella septempunctata]|uniref:DNA polymerase delta subunit 2 n=1 Tax=Coccinella septempunctata TaxID=41139 RepID=UPI001D09571B|nr:DNA polymerase delta subunit 2 [Coccinella septempunctata]